MPEYRTLDPQPELSPERYQALIGWRDDLLIKLKDEIRSLCEGRLGPLGANIGHHLKSVIDNHPQPPK